MAIREASFKMDYGNVRDAKFRHEIDQQKRFLKEFEAEIRAKIAEITDENQE